MHGLTVLALVMVRRRGVLYMVQGYEYMEQGYEYMVQGYLYVWCRGSTYMVQGFIYGAGRGIPGLKLLVLLMVGRHRVVLALLFGGWGQPRLTSALSLSPLRRFEGVESASAAPCGAERHATVPGRQGEGG